ncbi:MAG: hypothetical protein ABI977_20175 [Acidobacteriota bacterium]
MNKKWMKGLFSVAFVVALLPAAGWAQNRQYPGPPVRDQGVNDRQRQQQQRIREGLRSGELTRREARRLGAEDWRIRRNEAFARRSGGQFTPRERVRIERQLNRSSRNIYRQKHDRQDR